MTMSETVPVFKPSPVAAHERSVVRAPRRRAFVPRPVLFLDKTIETQIAACSLGIPPTSTYILSKTFVELKTSEEDSPVRQRTNSPLLDQALLRCAPSTPKAPLTNLGLLKSDAAKRVVKHERGLINARSYKDELERWVVHHTDSVTNVLQDISNDSGKRRDSFDKPTDLPKPDTEPVVMDTEPSFLTELPVSPTSEVAETDIKLPSPNASPLSTDRSGDTVHICLSETSVSENRVPDIDLSFLKTPPPTDRVITPPLSTGSSRLSDSPGWFNFPKIDNSALVSRPVGPVPALDLSFCKTPPSGGSEGKNNLNNKLQDLSSFLHEANKQKTQANEQIQAEQEFWANQSLQDLGIYLQQEEARKEAEISRNELLAEGEYWANQSLQDLGNFLKQEKAMKELQAEQQFWANQSLQDLGNYLKQEKAKKEREIAKKDMAFFKPEKVAKVEKPLKEIRSLPSLLAKAVPQYTSEHISRNFPTVHQELGLMWQNPTEPKILSPASCKLNMKTQVEKPAKNIFLTTNTVNKKEETKQLKGKASMSILPSIFKIDQKDSGDSKKSLNKSYDPYSKPLVPTIESVMGQNGRPILKIPAPPTAQKPDNKRMARHRKLKAAVMAGN